jgi:hypothetical protein
VRSLSELRRRRGWLGLAVALSVLAAPWPGLPATASCAAPYLNLAGDLPAPAPGGELVVVGRAFVDGCKDTGGATVFGCAVDEPEPEVPLAAVTLRLQQGGREWDLGTADAGTAEDGTLGQITWLVTMPADVQPGPARLLTDGSEPLTVEVASPGPAPRY